MGACDGKRMAGARAGAGQRQWPAGQSGLHLRGSDTGSAGFSCLGQPSTFLQAPDLAYTCTPKIEIFHSWNRKRAVCVINQMLLIVLITMVCSDLAYCNALSQYCKSKSEAPWRQGTG